MPVSESIRSRNYLYQPYIWSVAVFITIAMVGLYYVKWEPYYYKAITAAAKHSIGDSIIGADAGAPPSPSWKAAADYAWAYFLAGRQ